MLCCLCTANRISAGHSAVRLIIQQFKCLPSLLTSDLWQEQLYRNMISSKSIKYFHKYTHSPLLTNKPRCQTFVLNSATKDRSHPHTRLIIHRDQAPTAEMKRSTTREMRSPNSFHHIKKLYLNIKPITRLFQH